VGITCSSASGRRLEMSLKKLSQKSRLSMRSLIGNDMCSRARLDDLGTGR
jgi:hypothetical protein